MCPICVQILAAIPYLVSVEKYAQITKGSIIGKAGNSFPIDMISYKQMYPQITNPEMSFVLLKAIVTRLLDS
jgi:hypothetical protein